MFSELKKTMIKEVKKGMMTMLYQQTNCKKETNGNSEVEKYSNGACVELTRVAQ